MSHERIGDVLAAQGDGAGALASFRAGIEIRERLAQAYATNANRQCTLVVSYNNLAFACGKHGDSESATKYLRRGYQFLQGMEAADMTLDQQLQELLGKLRATFSD